MGSLMKMIGCAGKRPDDIGVRNGALTHCPDSPNCVCSCETRSSHHIAPLETTLDGVRAAIAQMPRTRLVSDTGDYLHVECLSRLLGFIDDLEFLAQPESGLVQVRSASRLGYSDLGANRRRIEALRRQLTGG